MKTSILKTAVGLSALLLVAVVAAASHAQVVYNNAATAEESWARGAADVVRAQGENALNNSQALMNLTQVRSAEMDNNLKSAQTYFEMRNLNTQQRFGDYAEKKAVNSQKQLFRYGQAGRPKRPSRKELDPVTGKISWPFVLQTVDFKAPRQQMDQLFRLRASQEGAIGLDGYQAINAASDAMQDILKAHISSLDPTDYVNGKNFIERLVYEARNPVDQ
ncbi:MAG: hypothetical protein K8T25_03495 [Planctomycetia bacterium]|nr:hypothetical protein [Planctomycetia bacterium]